MMSKKIIIMILWIVFCLLTANAEIDEWAVVDYNGKCYCFCDDCFYVAYERCNTESWGAEWFEIYKVYIPTGDIRKLDYKPAGFQIAILPFKDFILIVTNDYYEVEGNYNGYSLSIAKQNNTDEETVLLFVNGGKGNYLSFNDVIVDDEYVFIIKDNDIDVFDIKSREITNAFHSQEGITNSLYTNHSLILDHTIYFSDSSGAIMRFNCDDYSVNFLTNGFYQELPSDPNEIGHYGYTIIGDSLAYWNTDKKEMTTCDLYSGETGTLGKTKKCFWWEGTKMDIGYQLDMYIQQSIKSQN